MTSEKPMMRKYVKPKTGQGWNRFLKERYGYGVPAFIKSLDILKDESFEVFYPPDTEFPRCLKSGVAGRQEFFQRSADRLRRLREHIIGELDEYGKGCGMIDEKTPRERVRKFIINLYDLKLFFKRMGLEAERLEEAAGVTHRHRGAPIKPVHKIAFLWSEVIQDDRRIRWNIIIDLLTWISEHHKNKRLAQLLETSSLSKGGLSREYWIVFKRNENKEDRARMLQKNRSIYFPIPDKSIQEVLKGIRFTESDVQCWRKYKVMRTRSDRI